MLHSYGHRGFGSQNARVARLIWKDQKLLTIHDFGETSWHCQTPAIFQLGDSISILVCGVLYQMCCNVVGRSRSEPRIERYDGHVSGLSA